MKYDHEIDGVQLRRDVFADQFADAGDIRTRYWVEIYGDTIAESEDPKEIAQLLERVAKRLQKIATFLNSKKWQAGNSVAV